MHTLIQTTLHSIANNFRQHAENADCIAASARLITKALRQQNQVLFCGNGGSAADAQHLAAELMGRYLIDRKPQRALALSVDTSVLTAIANDYGYEEVFARQISGLGQADDVLVALSTSGTSPNIIAALQQAKQQKMNTIGLTGSHPNPMQPLCDICIQVPAERSDRIQELHIATGHLICELVEQGLYPPNPTHP